jgi:hypothetical protein
VDITDKFIQIRIDIADDGFVSILKKVTCPVMPVIEIDGITCEQPPHKSG